MMSVKEIKLLIKETIKKINKQIKKKKSKVYFDFSNEKIFWDFTEHMLISKKGILLSLLDEIKKIENGDESEK